MIQLTDLLRAGIVPAAVLPQTADVLNTLKWDNFIRAITEIYLKYTPLN